MEGEVTVTERSMVEPAEQFEILVQTNDIENEKTESSISGIKKVA